MDFDKIFRPNKWFVGFCGLLVVVWFVLQTVANMRISEYAKTLGANLFSWEWPSLDCKSQAEITDAKILRKSDADAIVEVKGRQTIMPDGKAAAGKAEVVDCDARLTFYKMNNVWILGRVDLQ